MTPGRKSADIAPAQVLFVPRNTSVAVEAGAHGLEAVSFGTVVTRS